MSLTPQQLVERRKFLGASEAAAALGLSDFFTPLQLYKAKLGEGEPIEETIPMKVGTALESVVLDLAEKELGKPIVDRQAVIYDPELPWRRATLDGRINKREAVEAKSSGQWQNWGRSEDAVPRSHIYQAQHQMACDDDLMRIWIPVILSQREFRMYFVDRDDELIELLTNGEIEFMQRVDERRPPDPINPDDLKILYPEDTGGIIYATEEINEFALMLHEVKKEKKMLESNEERLAGAIKSFMGEAAILRNASGKDLFTWKSHEVERIDVKKLREQRPDIADAFTVKSITRSLLNKQKDPK